MNPVKKDSVVELGVAAAPSNIATTCEYYLMIRLPSEYSEVPSYQKHVLPLDPQLQFRANSTIDMLDEHQAAAIENVIIERNARTIDAGEWVLSALSVMDGSKSASFKFIISLRNYNLPVDSSGEYPVVEKTEGKRKKVDIGQHGPGQDGAQSPIPESVPDTPGTGNEQQQPFPNVPANPSLEDSDLTSTVGPPPVISKSGLDSRSSTPVPGETRTQEEILIEELDKIEDLAWKILRCDHDRDRMYEDHKKALNVLSQVLNTRKKLMGKEDPKVLMALVHLAYDNYTVSEYVPFRIHGVVAVEDAMIKIKKVLGEKHPDTLMALHALANIHERYGNYNLAVRLFGQALKARAEVLGQTHEKTLDTMNSLAQSCDRLGWRACATEAVESLLECQKEVLGETHTATLKTMEDLAKIYARDNFLEKAESCISFLLELRKEISGLRDPTVGGYQCFLAEICLRRLRL